MPHMTFIGAVQVVTAVASCGTALVTLYLGIRNVQRLSIWWKSKRELVAANDSLSSQLKSMTQTAMLSHQAAIDVKMSVDSLRSSNEELLERVATLEARGPAYDAAMGWIPLVLEHVVWIESVAKANAFDLGGRQMPALPAIVIEYLKKNGSL